MITAVKLRERNPKKDFKLRTYTSANSLTRYVAGEYGTPSAWRIVDDPNELAELEKRPQFEIRQFESMAELEGYVQNKMEEGARMGLPPVRAQIQNKQVVKKRDLSVLKGATPETDDETKETTEEITEVDTEEKPAPTPPPAKPKSKKGKGKGKSSKKK